MTGRLQWVEAARFFAALSVMLWHFQHFATVRGAASFVSSEQPLYLILWPFYEYGHYGVQAFWLMSGYIFFWRYGDAISRGIVSGWQFFVFRFSRLYPLHLVTLWAVIVLQAVRTILDGSAFVYADNNASTLFLQLFMASGWTGETGSFNGPIWSVSVEVIVYFTFYFLARRFGPAAFVNLTVIGIAGLGMIAGVHSPVVTCFLCFYGGGLAAIVFGARSGAATIAQSAGNLTYGSYLLHFPVQLLIVTGLSVFGIAPDTRNPLLLVVYLTTTFTLAAIIYRTFEMPAQTALREALLRVPAHTRTD